MTQNKDYKDVLAALPPFDFKSVTGYDVVKAYFTNKPGWVSENVACWSSRDKIARIQTDGIGFNFEVWRVDGVPEMLYCQQLMETETTFLQQAANAGI